MNDIQNFLERKGAIVTASNGEDYKKGAAGDLSDDEEDEDDTLQDDELGHCLPRDDDHYSGCALLEECHLCANYLNVSASFFRGKEKTVRFGGVSGSDGHRGDFSPPRIPKNSPSYLGRTTFRLFS